MHTYSEDVFNKMASLYDSSSAIPSSEESAHKLDDHHPQRNSMPEIEFEEKAETTEEKDQESLEFERYFQITRNTGGLSFHEIVNDLYPSPDRVFPPRKTSISLQGPYLNDNSKFLKGDEFLSKAESNSKASDKSNLEEQTVFSSNKRQHRELSIETPSIKYEGQMLGDIVRRDGILLSASDDKVGVDKPNSDVNPASLRVPSRRSRIQIVVGSNTQPLSELELSNESKSDLTKTEAKMDYLNEQLLDSSHERNGEPSNKKLDSKHSDLLNHEATLESDESLSGGSDNNAAVSITDSTVNNTKMRVLSRRRRIQIVAIEEPQLSSNTKLSKDIKPELSENKAKSDHLKEQTVASDPVRQFEEQNKKYYFDFPGNASDDQTVITSENSDSSHTTFRPVLKRRRLHHIVGEPASLSKSDLSRSEESTSEGRENSGSVFSDESILQKNLDNSESTKPVRGTVKNIKFTDFFPSKEFESQDKGTEWISLEEEESSDERERNRLSSEKHKGNNDESYTIESDNAFEKDLLTRHKDFFINKQAESKASVSDFNEEFEEDEGEDDQEEDSANIDSASHEFREYSLESFPEETQDWMKSQFDSVVKEQHQSEETNRNAQFFYLTDGLLETEHSSTEADYNAAESAAPSNIAQVKRSEYFKKYREKDNKDQDEEVLYEYITISPAEGRDILNQNEEYFYASDSLPEAGRFEEADYNTPQSEGYGKQDFPAGKYENVHSFDLPRNYPSQNEAEEMPDEMIKRLRIIQEGMAYGRFPSVPNEAVEESVESPTINTHLLKLTSRRAMYQTDESEIPHGRVPFETAYVSEEGEFYIYSQQDEEENVDFYEGSSPLIFSNGAVIQGAEISRSGHALDPTMPGLIYTGLYAASKLNYDFGIPLEKEIPANSYSLHDVLYGNTEASNTSHVVEPSMPQLVYTGLRVASEVNFDFKDLPFEIGNDNRSSQEINAELSIPKAAEDSKASETLVETNSEMGSSVDTGTVNSTQLDVGSAEKPNESDEKWLNSDLKTVHTSDFESTTVNYTVTQAVTPTENSNSESSEVPANQDSTETPEDYHEQKQAVITEQITSHDTSSDSGESSNAPLRKIGTSSENFDSSSKKVLEDSLDSLNFKDEISDEEFYALLTQIASADPNSELHSSSKEKELYASSSGKTGADLIGTNIKEKTNKSPEMSTYLDGSAVKFPSKGKGKLKLTRKIDSSSMPSEMMYLNNPDSSSFQAHNEFSGFPTGYQQFSTSNAFSFPAQANLKTNPKKPRRSHSRKTPSSTNFSKLKSFAN
ncbi:hypothetical protein X975_25045, partial [Stegodyphus mimosarum]